MRFRPLAGYLLIVCLIVVYGYLSIRFFYVAPRLIPFIVGGVVGILMGLFLGRIAFQDVEPLLIVEGQMSGKESYNLFGSFPYRLAIATWLIFSSAVVFINPGSTVFVELVPIIDGLFHGGVLTYFLLFFVKAFLKERALNGRIFITVE